MKRTNNHLWKAVLFTICISCLVIRIDSVQDDSEKQAVITSENDSVVYGEEEQEDSKRKTGGIAVDSDNLIVNNGEKDELPIGVLAEITSKNAGALNDITTEGATLVVSLTETATSDLKAEAEKLTATPDAQFNVNVTNTTTTTTTNDADHFVEGATDEEIVDQINDRTEVESSNDTAALNDTKDAAAPPEEIPSFSEWTQKRMEEAEKKFVNESGGGVGGANAGGGNGKTGSVVKLGWKNYASPDCGAKVVAANAEAVSPSSVISPSREEYKLNVCTNRIWFIVELCEAIQAKKIDIANFELFSSTPKEFVVSIGDRFPSREWTTVGQFTAKDERDVQSFDLTPHLFGRYIKVEVKSHHGSQHYCPISLFRVYGISELEVLQKEEQAGADDDDLDDDDEMESFPDGLTKNMINSATNAVYSMIKKAAEVLGTKSNETNKTNDSSSKPEYSPLINTCSTPSHNVLCGNNCSDLLFGQVYELLSCSSAHIHNLATTPYVRSALANNCHVCPKYGLELDQTTKTDRSVLNKSCRYVEALFTDRILAAMCNSLALSLNAAVLNDSQHFPNSTKVPLGENADLGTIETSKTTIEQSIDVPFRDDGSVHLDARPTDALKLDLTSEAELPKVTCSTSLEYTSQIKPTKTIALDVLSIESSATSGETSGDALNHVPKTDQSASDSNGEGVATTDKIDAGGNVEEGVSEGQEGMGADHMDHFMGVDGNGENGGVTAAPVAPSGSDRQKESVFLRLSNRIKALERNVSLSSQYLEELSRRYKRQVEEMQKLERKIQLMLEERKKMEDKSKELEERIDNLTDTLEKWPGLIFWFITVVSIFWGVWWVCGSSSSNNTGERQRNDVDLPATIQRRNSVDMLPAKEKKKVRRPSDQALKIVRSSLIAEEKKQSLEKRRRKRSNKNLKRSNSINELEMNGFKSNKRDLLVHQDVGVGGKPGDWVEENRRLMEIVNLDDSENSSLEQFGTIMEHEQVPYYAKTASDRRASRISSSQYNNYTKKPNINGDQDFRKTDTESLSGNSPKLEKERRSSLNSKGEENSRKKEKRSFRSVLKNVFTLSTENVVDDEISKRHLFKFEFNQKISM